MKDYNYEILHHLVKANMVAGALRCKVTSAPIRDICLRMTIITPLLEQIREAQIEAVKEEHRKSD